jgi:Glycosyl transferase 4-like domain
MIADFAYICKTPLFMADSRGMDIRKIRAKKNRVAMILDTWFPVHTGEQVYVARLIRALADTHGYEVDLLTRPLNKALNSEQKAFESAQALRVKRLGWRAGPSNPLAQMGFVVFAFLHLLFSGQSYRLYHAHSATSALVMKLAGFFTRVPTVLTVHGNAVFDKQWTLRRWVHRRMFLKTSAPRTPS